jgi:hypothetical protein
MGVKVFWSDPSGFERIWLRRFRSSSRPESKCPHPENFGYHHAMNLFMDQRPLSAADEKYRKTAAERVEAPPRSDALWPTVCPCGYHFADEDPWQVFAWDLYTNSRDGGLFTLNEPPVGAMWDAHWLRGEGTSGEMYTGPDGISLMVRTPGGEWMVDAQASNCDRDQYGPGLDEEGRKWEKMWKGRTHYCWCRHGDPRTGNVHVDKSPEAGLATCGAGAGSIVAGSYHGFLHHGELTNC